MKIFISLFLIIAITSCSTISSKKLFELGIKPEKRYQQKFVYPPEAERDGIEGYVLVQYNIDKQGNTSNVKVVEAEPNNVFDESALNFIEQLQYKPILIDGKPVIVKQANQKIVFKLKEEKRTAKNPSEQGFEIITTFNGNSAGKVHHTAIDYPTRVSIISEMAYEPFLQEAKDGNIVNLTYDKKYAYGKKQPYGFVKAKLYREFCSVADERVLKSGLPFSLILTLDCY